VRHSQPYFNRQSAPETQGDGIGRARLADPRFLKESAASVSPLGKARLKLLAKHEGNGPSGHEQAQQGQIQRSLPGSSDARSAREAAQVCLSRDVLSIRSRCYRSSVRLFARGMLRVMDVDGGGPEIGESA
jgi:hypothetical protein